MKRIWQWQLYGVIICWLLQHRKILQFGRQVIFRPDLYSTQEFAQEKHLDRHRSFRSIWSTIYNVDSLHVGLLVEVVDLDSTCRSVCTLFLLLALRRCPGWCRTRRTTRARRGSSNRPRWGKARETWKGCSVNICSWGSKYFVSSGLKYFVVYMWGSESWDMMWALINAKIMWDKDSAKPKTEKKLTL